MIELHEVGLIEGLPPDVVKEPWVQILDAVFRERRKKELEAAERLKIYTDIDRADEAVLDILAVQFRVDWYDTSYPIETKRRIIKTALEVRRYCGTEWAVQKALSSIYPNVKISEWYDYGGRSGYWRMNVDITDDGVIYYTPEEIEKGSGSSTTVSSGSNGLTAKIFLLSAAETSLNIGSSMPNGEGSELAYFKGCADKNADSKRIAKDGRNAKRWWLRSPYCSISATSAMIIDTSGDWNFSTCTSSNSIRPAFILPPSPPADPADASWAAGSQMPAG